MEQDAWQGRQLKQVGGRNEGRFSGLERSDVNAAGSKFPGRLIARSFFEASSERVAPRLLGKLLVHRTHQGILAGRIIEVEAYLGPHHRIADPAAHSHRGPTPRNSVMFGPAGHAYVYAIYGLYYCMNITCEKSGRGSGVL